MTMNATVTFGLRAKTGRAILVVLHGPLASPEVLARRELILSDPKVPESFQPYHAVMELPWDEGVKAARKTVRIIQNLATSSLRDLVKEYGRSDLKVGGVGVVGSGKQNLEKIGNYHIRAHAAEGQLFREVLEVGAAECGLPVVSFTEEQLHKQAPSIIRRSAAELDRRLSSFKKTIGPPWRRDEKTAAVAAWVALASS
jgi:hypothetical protein